MRLPPSMDGNEKREKMAIMETAISSSLSHPNVVQTFTYSVQQVPRCPDTKSLDLPSSAAQGLHAPQSSLAEVDGEGGTKLGGWDKPEGGSSWEVRLVQEYCEAGSLRELLDKKAFHPPGRDVDLCAVLDTAIDVARALDHLHRQGIVHADLKPRNVLLKANPLVQRGFVAKVADFGLSVKVAPGKDHVDGVVQGTLSHMAPETLLHGHLGPPADVYAFGIMLWELMTAQRAYRGLPKTLIAHGIAHEELRPSFPPTAPATLAALASDCWAARPEARPPFPVILAELTAYRAMMFGQEHAGDVSGSLALLTLSAHHLLLPPPQQPYLPAATPHLPPPSTQPPLGPTHSRALASTPGAARGPAGQRLSDDGQGQLAAEWVERSAQRASLMLQRQFPASTGAAAANPDMAGGCQGWQSVRARHSCHTSRRKQTPPLPGGGGQGRAWDSPQEGQGVQGSASAAGKLAQATSGVHCPVGPPQEAAAAALTTEYERVTNAAGVEGEDTTAVAGAAAYAAYAGAADASLYHASHTSHASHSSHNAHACYSSPEALPPVAAEGGAAAAPSAALAGPHPSSSSWSEADEKLASAPALPPCPPGAAQPPPPHLTPRSTYLHLSRLRARGCSSPRTITTTTSSGGSPRPPHLLHMHCSPASRTASPLPPHQLHSPSHSRSHSPEGTPRHPWASPQPSHSHRDHRGPSPSAFTATGLGSALLASPAYTALQAALTPPTWPQAGARAGAGVHTWAGAGAMPSHWATLPPPPSDTLPHAAPLMLMQAPSTSCGLIKPSAGLSHQQWCVSSGAHGHMGMAAGGQGWEGGYPLGATQEQWGDQGRNGAGSSSSPGPAAAAANQALGFQGFVGYALGGEVLQVDGWQWPGAGLALDQEAGQRAGSGLVSAEDSDSTYLENSSGSSSSTGDEDGAVNEGGAGAGQAAVQDAPTASVWAASNG
ncbi:hypothetical protein V8C86DRAFT_3029997 [Haematococcus lacustris]